MRRTLILLLTACLVLVAAVPAVSAQARPIQVLINGRVQEFADAPFIEGGRTLVPLRAIFEALGAGVSWDNATKTVTASRGDRTVVLTIGAAEARVNGQPVRLDVPGIIRSGRTFVPLRFVSEAMGADVGWDGATRTVIIVDLIYLSGTADPAALALLRKAVMYPGPAQGDLTASLRVGPAAGAGDSLSMDITGQVRGADVYYRVDQTLTAAAFGTFKGTSHLAARGGKVYIRRPTDQAFSLADGPARLDQLIPAGLDPSRPFASPLAGGIAGVALGPAQTIGGEAYQELQVTLSAARLKEFFADVAQGFGTNLEGVAFDVLEARLLVRTSDGFARQSDVRVTWTVVNPDASKVAYAMTFAAGWADPAGPIQWPAGLPG